MLKDEAAALVFDRSETNAMQIELERRDVAQEAKTTPHPLCPTLPSVWDLCDAQDRRERERKASLWQWEERERERDCEEVSECGILDAFEN